jgi:ribulose-5-phosphate 4-epimerase/fuculose-1-phosphate aldolase
MCKIVLENLAYISQHVGKSADYTQGGGGNTSAKIDDKHMAVKASGFKLSQITPKDGYVIVDYEKIREYHKNADLSADTDYEKESTEFVKSNIIEVEGLAKLRPSVEAGFHSILQKYVVHTHSVYANILCCTENGKEIVQKAFKDKDYATAWIPYINPGFFLTLEINKAINESLENSGKFPQAIFMENHGLVVTSVDAADCIELHDDVNETIKKYLGIQEEYPEVKIESIDENTFKSNTRYLIDIFSSNQIDSDFIDRNVLYPDQLVYLNGNIDFNGSDKKISINSKTGDIVYCTSFSEAMAMDETLAAYFYVIFGIKKHGLTLKTMTEKDIGYILNWEGEAYRKSIIQKGKIKS